MSASRLIVFTMILVLALTAPGKAQYGGGGGTGTGGTSSGGGYGGGSKTALYVVGYAAAGTALYVYLLTRPTRIVGCVSEGASGLLITADKDKKQYQLESGTVDLRPGTHVQVSGRKSKYTSTTRFRAKKLEKELGACETAPSKESATLTK